MSVLAEAESMASYSRKRLALSYERPTTPKRRKSHSPKEANMSWDIDGAMEELENFPPNQKINCCSAGLSSTRVFPWSFPVHKTGCITITFDPSTFSKLAGHATEEEIVVRAKAFTFCTGYLVPSELQAF